MFTLIDTLYTKLPVKYFINLEYHVCLVIHEKTNKQTHVYFTCHNWITEMSGTFHNWNTEMSCTVGCSVRAWPDTYLFYDKQLVESNFQFISEVRYIYCWFPLKAHSTQVVHTVFKGVQRLSDAACHCIYIILLFRCHAITMLF